MGIRIELIPIRHFFRDAGKSLVNCLYFFLFDIIVVFLVSIILAVGIGPKAVLTEPFVTAYAFIIVTVYMPKGDMATQNHCKVFWNNRDKYGIGGNRSMSLRFGVVFSTIDALRNEVLLLCEIEAVIMLH